MGQKNTVVVHISGGSSVYDRSATALAIKIALDRQGITAVIQDPAGDEDEPNAQACIDAFVRKGGANAKVVYDVHDTRTGL